MTDEQDPTTAEPLGYDPYWQHHVILGDGEIEGKSALIRLRMHRSGERYSNGEPFIPLTSRSGKRVYFHAKPYILIPDITVTVALSQPNGEQTRFGMEVGRVVGSNVKKLKPLEIGNAQAWYYPEDRVLMLWECYVEARFRRQDDPNQDALHQLVWNGFENVLLKELTETSKIYTVREPIYDNVLFAQFLAGQGYKPFEKVSFYKDVLKDQS